MTNQEYIYKIQKEIEGDYSELQKYCDNSGYNFFYNLLLKIISQKFRILHPGSLSCDDMVRNENHYSWYMAIINSMSFYEVRKTEEKLKLVDSLIRSSDILKWCFENIKSKY